MAQIKINLTAVNARMRLSRKRLLLIVEGKTDRNIYESLAKKIFEPKGISYQIYRVEEFNVSKGGKDGIIELFEFLKDRNSLNVTDGYSKTDCILFLDKDIDDILGKVILNNHLIYTRYYTIENELFINGDLKKSISVALDINTVALDSFFLDQKRWLYDMASSWKEWVCICIFVRLKDIHYGATFNRNSIIHSELGVVDNQDYNRCISDLKGLSNFTDIGFKRELSKVTRLVDNQFSSDTQYHTIFNGKWFFFMIERKITTSFDTKDITITSFKDKLRSNLIMSLNFEDEFINYYKDALDFIEF